MINLSFDELRLAQIRNISDYENRSKEDLIRALSETKPKPETKPQTPKPETPETTKPKPERKPEIRVNKRKLRKLRKSFEEKEISFCNTLLMCKNHSLYVKYFS